MENQAKSVLRYYVLCNRLKNIIRIGFTTWNVKRERIESIAEHIYGVQMLALAMYSEYKYDIDILHVIMMLAVHELEEIKTGDYIHFDDKSGETIGHAEVEIILQGMLKKDEIMALVEEFEKRETKEAQFAYHCDKLEFELQSRIYDEEGCVDLNYQPNNITLNHPDVRRLLDQGKSFSEMMFEFGRGRYNYDEHFTEVSEYAERTRILDLPAYPKDHEPQENDENKKAK